MEPYTGSPMLGSQKTGVDRRLRTPKVGGARGWEPKGRAPRLGTLQGRGGPKAREPHGWGSRKVGGAVRSGAPRLWRPKIEGAPKAGEPKAGGTPRLGGKGRVGGPQDWGATRPGAQGWELPVWRSPTLGGPKVRPQCAGSSNAARQDRGVQGWELQGRGAPRLVEPQCRKIPKIGVPKYW